MISYDAQATYSSVQGLCQAIERDLIQFKEATEDQEKKALADKLLDDVKVYIFFMHLIWSISQWCYLRQYSTWNVWAMKSKQWLNNGCLQRVILVLLAMITTLLLNNFKMLKQGSLLLLSW